MILPIQSLNYANEQNFSQLKQRVRRRLESTASLNWLLETENAPLYQSDYLTMATLGYNRLEQLFNRIVGRMSHRLWYRFLWPIISKKTFNYLEDQYLKRLFNNFEDKELLKEINQYIIISLRDFLSRKWQNKPQCTFTEMANSLLEIIHEPLKQLNIDEDYFLKEKQAQNKACMDLLKQLHRDLEHSPNRLGTLIYLTSRANWIDSVETDITDKLDDFISDVQSHWMDNGLISNMPKDSRFFQLEKVKDILNSTSGPILYETDNCGEIVFDLALVEELISRGRKVFLCVKEEPLLNDAMEKDVRELLADEIFSGLRQAVHQGRLSFITAGVFKGGGKLVHEVNESYKQAYMASDLLIIKGQGNFQSMPMALPTPNSPKWYPYKKPIIFITGVRADMIRMSLIALFPAKQRPPVNSILLQVFNSKNP